MALDDVVNNSTETLSIEDKFAKALLRLRKIRPFYSSIYEILDRKESSAVKTIGVSSTELVYNKEFIEKLTFPELIFCDLHEIGHVALMHTSRIGDRDATLYNIACALYVNKLLSEEFGITPGRVINEIKMPEDALFCSSLDLNEECVENIYEILNNQAKKQGYYNGNIVTVEYEGANRDGTSYSKFYMTIQRENNHSYKIGGTGESCNSSTSGNNEDNNGNCKDNGGNSGNGSGNNKEELHNDIMESVEDSNTNQQNNKRIVSEALTKAEMSKQCGNETGECLLSVYAEKCIKSYIDWRKLLLKYCIASTSKDSSFKMPDKRMFYQNAIYPGQSIDESNTIKGIKVCFDISGSISNNELVRFYGQVRNILKKFKIKAEVIYWDTEIKTKTSLVDIKDINGLDVYGRGGTDPSCIFEYFDSKECKIKPIVTVIFTDGYIHRPDNEKWKKKYKDTIWVVTNSGDEKFKPPFGKVTIDKY